MPSFVWVDISNFFGNIHGALVLPPSWLSGIHMEAVHVPSVCSAVSQRELQRAKSPLQRASSPTYSPRSRLHEPLSPSQHSLSLVNHGTVGSKLVSTMELQGVKMNWKILILAWLLWTEDLKLWSEISFVSAFQIMINIWLVLWTHDLGRI